MRRICLVACAAAAALIVSAVPASARVESHFSVETKEVSSRGDRDSFRLHEALFAPGTNVQVGNDRVRCHFGGEKIKCRAVINLNGKLAGEGSLFVNGNIGPGDNRLNIVGGTGDFNGAAGKLIAAKRLHFHIVY